MYKVRIFDVKVFTEPDQIIAITENIFKDLDSKRGFETFPASPRGSRYWWNVCELEGPSQLDSDAYRFWICSYHHVCRKVNIFHFVSCPRRSCPCFVLRGKHCMMFCTS